MITADARFRDPGALRPDHGEVIQLVPVIVGLGAVLQGALNRRIAGRWGLPAAALLNATVLLVAVGCFFLLAKTREELLPVSLRLKPMEEGPSVWFVLPGLLGFALVAGIPWAIGEIGALQVFVLSISSQLLGSMAWDALAEGKPVTWNRVGGVLLAIAGALLATRK